MNRDAALAVALVLCGASDWTLTVTQRGIQTNICAKSRDTCEAARSAIAAGRWSVAPPDAVTECRPSPDCFSPESERIKGSGL